MTQSTVSTKTPIHESLRIAWKKVYRDERIEVFNPWDNSVV